MNKRRRDIQVKFYVDEKELERINRRVIKELDALIIQLLTSCNMVDININLLHGV